MCKDCGCSLPYAPRAPASARTSPTHEEILAVHKSLHGANASIASRNRALFRKHGILVLNLMSSPGTGKTALLEALIPRLPLRCGVIVGDLETDNDARRIARTGAPTLQITTGQACHLDAAMIADYLPQLDLPALDILFIENVGNLVCPASFDLGESKRIALLSVCEGDDKPAKYPGLFHRADLMLITKADLLPHLPQFNPAHAEHCLRELASQAPCLQLSSLLPESLTPLQEWLCTAHAAQQPTHTWKVAG